MTHRFFSWSTLKGLLAQPLLRNRHRHGQHGVAGGDHWHVDRVRSCANRGLPGVLTEEQQPLLPSISTLSGIMTPVNAFCPAPPTSGAFLWVQPTPTTSPLPVLVIERIISRITMEAEISTTGQTWDSLFMAVKRAETGWAGRRTSTPDPF